MKNFSFIIFLFLPVFCFAQNKVALSHFWSIPWGVPIERVEAIIQDRGLDSFREGNTLITEAQYEGEDALIVFLFNRVNRFYSGNVIYPANEDLVMSKYNNFRLLLARRYGRPDTAVEFFESPFEKGDGREIEAIITENAFFFSEWEFGNACLASVTILNNLDVCLTFRNPALADRN